MVWVVLSLGVLTVFLLLAVLGAMREVVLMRGELEAFGQLVKRPPPPSYVEATLPAPLVDVLDETLAPGVDDGGLMVAFVSPGCKPCEDLVLGLSAAAEERRLRREDLFFVVWAMKDADAERMVPDLPGQAVSDSGGSLARTCEIRGTPTVFVVSRSDYRVLDYDMEGDTEWVLSHLMHPEPVATAS
jgi:hypothetical protein